MGKYLAWGITGAGHFLVETVSVMKRLKNQCDVKITTYISRGGEEVLRMYGLLPEIPLVSPGGYYEEVFTSGSIASYPSSGRLQLQRYCVLAVSPCSANTVAKVVHGVADTLVTNLVAQAQKGGVSIYVLPTDQYTGETETPLPYRVRKELCRGCDACPPLDACVYGAVELVEGKARINLEKCWGCGVCLRACPFQAITFMDKAKVKTRRVDVENVKRLRGMEGIHMLDSPQKLEETLLILLQGNCGGSS